jgi:hypothetical protein
MGFLHDLVSKKVTTIFRLCLFLSSAERVRKHSPMSDRKSYTQSLYQDHFTQDGDRSVSETVCYILNPKQWLSPERTNLKCNIPSAGQYKTEKLQSFTHFNILIQKVTI